MQRDLAMLKQEICDVGARLYQRGLVAGSDGNLSVRLTDEHVLCTPSGLCKGTMQPDDLCLVDLQGDQLAGRRPRSSEVLLHLQVMKARPDVQAVVHSHPPHATAFAIVGKPLPRAVSAEAEIVLGEVPIAPYATPGTTALAESVLPFVHQSNVCLLANHGVVTYAASLEQAWYYTEALESYCHTLHLAQQLGQPRSLSDAQCAQLQETRERAGFAPPPRETEK